MKLSFEDEKDTDFSSAYDIVKRERELMLNMEKWILVDVIALKNKLIFVAYTYFSFKCLKQ